MHPIKCRRQGERRKQQQSFPYVRDTGYMSSLFTYVDERLNGERRAIVSTLERDALFAQPEAEQEANPATTIWGDEAAMAEVVRRINILARALRYYAACTENTLVAKQAMRDTGILP